MTLPSLFRHPWRRSLADCVLAALVSLAWAPSPCAALGDDVPADHAEQMEASMDLFKQEVRALLLQHCVDCHGGKETHGEFDLTTRDGLLKGGQLGPAVVARNPSESLLLKLIRHEGEPNMPQDADKLSDAAIEQIATWIAGGAAYDRPLVDPADAMAAKPLTSEQRNFWSFLPLETPEVPAVENDAWCRTPLDRFVLAKLEAAGLEPNPAADRRTLIRRAYLDLVGLLPTPEEVEAFVADSEPDAYGRLIDRLLDSPHYGERWGRHWLDLARFAESHGYEQDDDRPTAYHYRDFVIQALNDDMPYDKFVRWQIAGDELAPDDHRALMATGFLAAGTHATQITANQVEKERYDELDDMASTIGTSMLGLTIGCARCHDHKFDPISQVDYYRFLSRFTTTCRSEIKLDFQPEIYQRKKAEFVSEHAPLVEALEHFENEELASRFEAWLATDVERVMPTWLVLDVASMKSEGGATFTKDEDGAILVSGKNASEDTYTFVVPTKVSGIKAVRLEALAHESLPHDGPGRADNGNFALSDFQLWSAPTGNASPGAPVKLSNPKVTDEQEGLPITATIDYIKKGAWAVDGKIGQNHAASFALETPIDNPDGTTLTFILKFQNNTGHNLGRLRFSLSTLTEATSPKDEAAPEAEVEKVNAALSTPPGERTGQQRETLLAWYRPRDPQWQKLKEAVRKHQAAAPKPELTKVLIASEGLPAVRLRTQGADFFEKTYFLKRGDLKQKVGEADQSFLQVLMRVPQDEGYWQETPPDGWRTSYRRRSLANWITDVDAGAGPLLARVIVNRLWQHHLGQGIVRTPSDFGASGERPTHPQLLEYLAGELIAGDWRLKRLHKQIMTSAVYMQTADTDETRAAIDSENHLLWHRERQRLEAEIIRDAMLSASGLLDERMFGPGTLDPEQKRRSIYFTVKRSKLIPSMMLYDAPDALLGLGRRSTTIIAPQALSMINSQQVQSYAEAFADRLLSGEEGSTDELVTRGYEIALARRPDEAELADSCDFIEQAFESYRMAEHDEPRKQAVADFCQVLFGLNEFIYVD